MGALSHLRVVAIGSAAAASYCARLFADFGATVQKVEPPRGHPLRRSAPFTPKGQSAWFASLNFNKSSVALDPNGANPSSRLAELIGSSDILIDGRDIDDADCPAIDLAALKQANPGLIHVEAGWFGRDQGCLRQRSGLCRAADPQGAPYRSADRPRIDAWQVSAFGGNRGCAAPQNKLATGTGVL
jgi:crotonobetainyl-CoA:carnitine CoA-transferase CaiB-like acyl-CoA transferase